MPEGNPSSDRQVILLINIETCWTVTSVIAFQPSQSVINFRCLNCSYGSVYCQGTLRLI